MFNIKKQFKLPGIYKIIGYDNNIPIVREKTSEDKVNDLVKVKWSWFENAIIISSTEYKFLLYPTEIVKMCYRDAEIYYYHNYDNFGYSQLPSETQAKIIIKNRDKINKILKRKKCPTIPKDSKLWIKCPTYAYINTFGEMKQASLSETNIPLCVRTIL